MDLLKKLFLTKFEPKTREILHSDDDEDESGSERDFKPRSAEPGEKGIYVDLDITYEHMLDD